MDESTEIEVTFTEEIYYSQQPQDINHQQQPQPMMMGPPVMQPQFMQPLMQPGYQQPGMMMLPPGMIMMPPGMMMVPPGMMIQPGMPMIQAQQQQLQPECKHLGPTMNKASMGPCSWLFCIMCPPFTFVALCMDTFQDVTSTCSKCGKFMRHTRFCCGLGCCFENNG